MKHIPPYFLILALTTICVLSCNENVQTDEVQENYVAQNYTKQEVDIEMRDGVKLHTTIYSP